MSFSGILLALIGVVVLGCVQNAESSDCTALVSVYSATAGPQWKHSWDVGVVEGCCSWSGVQCSGNRVVNVTLKNFGLRGTLPEEIGELTAIQYLDVSVNHLTGTIPALPPWPNAVQLNFGGNSLYGPLPELDGFANIQQLFLNYNRFNGTLPAAWGDLSDTLIDIAINDNGGIRGTLPTEWSSLTKLQHLWSCANLLAGSVPVEWAAMSSVTFLDLAANRLEGTLDLSSLPPNLFFMNLTFNGFTEIAGYGSSSPIVLLLSGNPIRALESPPGVVELFKHSSLLLLEDTDLHWDLLELKKAYISPLMRMRNNPGVTGDLSVFGEILQLGVDTTYYAESYIGLDFSNCSLTGNLSSLVVNGFLALEVLNISHNAGIYGSLPVQQLGMAADFVLDVGGLNISGPAEELPFGPSIDTYATYSCPKIEWLNGVAVQGLTPAYYGYHGCSCSVGYGGRPPHCHEISHTTERILVATLSVVVVVLSAIIMRPRVQRWWWRRKDWEEAHDILQQYVGRGGDVEALLTGTTTLPDHWKIDYKDLDIVRTVAAGSTGSVALAIWNRMHVAVKKFHATLTDDEYMYFATESQLHGQLRHPHVVQLLGVCVDPICLVTEWMDRGSLFDVLRHERSTMPPVRSVALGIAKGMLYLHKRGVLHRDLKSMNVLLNQEGVVKVADFGHARIHAEGTMTTGCGTNAWMAPEVFKGGHYDEKCDVYSFAIVLWELLTGDIPYHEGARGAWMEQHVCSGGRLPLPEDGDPSMISLIQRCWSEDPSLRPGFDVIVAELEEMADK